MRGVYVPEYDPAIGVVLDQPVQERIRAARVANGQRKTVQRGTGSGDVRTAPQARAGRVD